MTTIAQQIKTELKAAFPGVKFTCKMYHSTANIAYVDGPTKLEVEAIAKKYDNSGYDFYSDCHYGSHSVYVYRTFSERLNNDVLDAMEAKDYSRECPNSYDEAHHWNEAYNYFITGETTKIDPEHRMALLAERAAEAAALAEDEANGVIEAEAEFVISPVEVPTTPFFTSAKFAVLNKNCTIAEYKEECFKPEFNDDNRPNWRINEVKVTKVFALTAEDYDWFVNGGLMGVESATPWIEGLGGTDSHNDHYYDCEHFHELTEAQQKHWLEGAYTLEIAVYAPDRDVFFVDPQGYNYARYVGLSLSQCNDKNLLLHHADKTEQPQIKQSPAALPPALSIVPADFNPRNNPTFIHKGETVYVVKFGQTVAGVPTTWICQGMSGNRYEVESAVVMQYTQKAA